MEVTVSTCHPTHFAAIRTLIITETSGELGPTRSRIKHFISQTTSKFVTQKYTFCLFFKSVVSPFYSQEWSNSHFLCSLTRNIKPHSTKNLAFHSLLTWKMIILPILATSLIHFSSKGRENVLFEVGSERVNTIASTPYVIPLQRRDGVFMNMLKSEGKASPTRRGDQVMLQAGVVAFTQGST